MRLASSSQSWVKACIYIDAEPQPHHGPWTSACMHFSLVLYSTSNIQKVPCSPSVWLLSPSLSDILQQAYSLNLRTQEYLPRNWIIAFKKLPIEMAEASIAIFWKNNLNYWKVMASVFKYNPSHEVLCSQWHRGKSLHRKWRCNCFKGTFIIRAEEREKKIKSCFLKWQVNS